MRICRKHSITLVLRDQQSFPTQSTFTLAAAHVSYQPVVPGLAISPCQDPRIIPHSMVRVSLHQVRVFHHFHSHLTTGSHHTFPFLPAYLHQLHWTICLPSPRLQPFAYDLPPDQQDPIRVAHHRKEIPILKATSSAKSICAISFSPYFSPAFLSPPQVPSSHLLSSAPLTGDVSLTFFE